mgnify:CR=1 FL=1
MNIKKENKEKKSQEEINKEIARIQWDSWITDSKNEEDESTLDEQEEQSDNY